MTRKRGFGWAVAALLLAGCSPRAPTTATVRAPQDMSVAPSAGPSLAACEEQASTVQDGLVRLADRYLWEEIDKLVRAYAAAGAGAGEPCAEATREALTTVTLRWAEQGAESGGAQSHTLARQAYAALRQHFPAAADTPQMHHAMGRLEWARAEKLTLEIGERTLTDDALREAHAHHRAALAGGLPADQAARSARAQLDAVRRVYDGPPRRWVMSEQTCLPDPRGRCTDPVPRVAPGELTTADREWLAAYDAFLAEPGLQGATDHGQVAVERAELLMLYRRWDEAEAGLRAVTGPAREQARVLLVGLLLARWMESASAGERSTARVALVTAATEVEAAGAPQAAQVAALRRAALWAQAEESEAAGDDAGCGAAFEALYADLGADVDAAAEAADGAGRCYERAGMTQKAIDWLERMADVHREDARAPDAVLQLARLHERILNDEQARDRYLDLVARAPRHRAAATARRRSLILSLRAGTLPEGQLDALIRGRPEERTLAAAIQFRAVIRPGVAPEAAEKYIERFGKEGGPRRLAIAYTRAAEAYLRASCPVHGAEGLCVEFGRDRTPARVVPRLAKPLAKAREHLDRAEKLLPEVSAGEPDKLEAPLAVDVDEARAASRQVALLLGDLKAESALTSQPPKSLDPTRSRAWLDVRKDEVERMSAVYEGATAGAAGGRDQAAALIETRKAQVYESDLALLDEVAAAVEQAGDIGLAQQMRDLAAQRREAVFTAYARCLDHVAAWGHDPSGQSALCRAGLGRLVGRYEEPLEYAPDIDGRVLVGAGATGRSQTAVPVLPSR
ncbi:hypothetical protein [Nannocystis radixulma]|uniref:Uncharacterized protein n=1 Tax=Nannocystis radixulma TaxID=2995305 RepID=A0ABT5BJ24_9BACT|nr:hypothetical protein [Nannocystis radixulma]MDC0674160.1 hypothetical protein [Nannocystis radixulma]